MKKSLLLVWAITLSTVVLQLSSGLITATVPMRMNMDGFSSVNVGFAAAAYGAGFTLGCLAAPAFIRYVGHIRVFASQAAVLSIVMLLFSQAGREWHWILLRAVMGFGIAGMFTIADAWISGSAPASHRGRVFSFYTVCTKMAMIVGPMLVTESSIVGPGLFMMASVFCSACLIPIAATHTVEPPPPASVNLNLLELYRVAPSAVVGCLGIGLMSATINNMASLYGVQIGLNKDAAAMLLVALQAGSLIFQWPWGWLSDRFDRRYVIIFMTCGALAAAVMVLFVSTRTSEPLLIWLSFMAFGGTAMCIYSVCVAHACDLVPNERIVPAVSGLLMIWAFGSSIGPAPAGKLMETFGPNGVFYWSVAVAVCMIAFIWWRTTRRVLTPTKGGFSAAHWFARHVLPTRNIVTTDEHAEDFEDPDRLHNKESLLESAKEPAGTDSTE
ncbi:MAG: MFS transporter [Methylobacteriaceae bacterium]|nr:MFS transporter [Methylobacteriaceae bacterium]